MDTALDDLRCAARNLRKSPVFAIVAILTLALGIGANSAIFSLIDKVLLTPVPYPTPNRLYSFVTTYEGGSLDRASAAKFNSWRTYATSFDHLAAYRFTTASMTAGAEPEQVAIGEVSADFFPLFGATIINGRTFSSAEDRPGGGDVVVLSYGYWQRRFGGNPDMVGSALSIRGAPHTVVGILSPRFRMPEVDPSPDVWLPFQIDPHSTEQAHLLWVAGRLRPDHSLAEAGSELGLAADDFRRRYPEMLDAQERFGVQPYQQLLVRGVRPSLRLLTLAVACVLLLACANVANLTLARALLRRRDIAMRVALGATRGRIIRLLLTESLILAMAGGMCGFLIGIGGIHVLLTVTPVALPGFDPLDWAAAIDWRVIAFTIAVSVFTGVAAGLMPALHTLQTDLNVILKEGGNRSGGTSARNTMRAVLAAAQIALACVLLTVAALLTLTLASLRAVDPGFSSASIVTMGIDLGTEQFSTTASVARFVHDAEERLKALPGVVAATSTCCLPLGGKYGHLGFDIIGRSSTTATGDAGWVSASPGYFDVFRIPLRRGRVFTEQDTASAAPVVIIGEALAAQYWPAGNAIGQQVLIGRGMGPQFVERPRQIIGIVGDVRETLGARLTPMLYVPTAQLTDGMTRLLNQRLPMAWGIRTVGPPIAMSPLIQTELRQASGGIRPSSGRTMDDLRRGSTARAAFNMVLLCIFAAAALALASLGVYALMTNTVQERSREMALRIALGATASDVRNLVARQGLAISLAGVAVGLIVTVGVTRVTRSLLFGVTPLDSRIFISVAMLLGGVAFVGVWLPARRATSVDPAVVLRGE